MVAQLQTIARPVLPKSTEWREVNSDDCLEIKVEAAFVLMNPFWAKDGEQPDVQILELTLSSAAGSGETLVSPAFFSDALIRSWEREIAQALEAEDRDAAGRPW